MTNKIFFPMEIIPARNGFILTHKTSHNFTFCFKNVDDMCEFIRNNFKPNETGEEPKINFADEWVEVKPKTFTIGIAPDAFKSPIIPVQELKESE